MNTLIISNRLAKTSVNEDVELYHWTHKRPSAANYRNVVLDLYFGLPDTDGYVKLEGTSQNFYEIGAEILRCLSAGGIVIASLGPVAVNKRSLSSRSDQVETLALKRNGPATYHDKYKGEYETSYDWLDQGFLEDTKLDALHKKRSSNIEVLVKWEEAQNYFNMAQEFWTTIEGLSKYGSDTRPTMTYRVEEGKRWFKSHGGVSQHKAWILAISEHTREPVAIAINYLRQPGTLVLVPPFSTFSKPGGPANVAESPKVERCLVRFAQSIKEQINRLESPEIPDWAKKCRAPKAVEMVNTIERHKRELDSLNAALIHYDEMLYLLCARGELLQHQAQKLFSTNNEGIKVEPTPSGSSLDLFVIDKAGNRLAIEVTGVKGKLTKNDHHWADFLHYLPEHQARNQNARVERIVLVVNTQCDLPLEERTRKDDITPPVLRIAEDNHICVIRSCDLYDLWLETQSGLTMQKVFDSIFECEGVYDFHRVKRLLKSKI